MFVREYQEYRRTEITSIRPYIPGEDLTGVSVSSADKILIDSFNVLEHEKGNPFQVDPENFGGIARNPDNHEDQWYIAPDYFIKNFEVI
jgi:hypothetical protein